MNIEDKIKLIVDALEDIKARDIVVLDTRKLTSLFERMVIASGDSNRQTRALADNVREKVKEAGEYVGNTEGEETGDWVLLDLGEVIVHVMQPAARAHYNLEELWGAGQTVRARTAGA
ncbi:ribosome silencing factor [Betaproteobacteria bacterium SCN1]|jgi:ribosome-associated protein|nr:ribosome silencing factor [Betaproteobacteria bacterium SCN1]MBN8759091.1 ribosome silencing factor [Thiobacillus sp.]ODU91171.1 MAG: ribosome silencing factor [Thiobacillus sp. SCN 65-179]OJW38073.1 MAG: ribosome silencing factor [Thiobacillus sp. 65-69]